MTALARVTAVEHLGARLLRVTFSDGLVRELDFADALPGVLATIDDDAAFAEVTVDSVAGTTVVVLDGGVHHLLRPALVGQEHRLRALGVNDGTAAGGRVVPVTVAGPLCSGLDVFSQSAVMRPPEVGELVAVLDVGAYGFTESMPLFLSHPVPAEIAIHGGRVALIRPRQEPSTWLDLQLLPDWQGRDRSVELGSGTLPV